MARISNSFSDGEIQVMDFILSTLLRGGTPAMAVRSKDFSSLCRKVQAMKSKSNDIREGRVTTTKRNPEKSSVGLIEAPDSDSESDDDSLESVG